ncbi:MAG: CYTH domain-containing protein [Hyphomicrobiales bacterium]|nr:CYTH domain-containing protein [Hyphomicrobiales bacterium]
MRTATGQRPVKEGHNRFSSDLPTRSVNRGFSAADYSGDDPFREIELKLTGTSRNLSAIFDALGSVSVAVTTVRSTYYDTDDRRLWRRGYTFRRRWSEGEDEVTLKRRDGGALARGQMFGNNKKINSRSGAAAAMPSVVAGDPDKTALTRLADSAQSRRRVAYRSIRRMVGERWFNGSLFDLLLAGEGGGSIRPDKTDTCSRWPPKFLRNATRA